ncbi:unnamed protein product [Ectocarpus fasciculatus]
MVWMKATTDQRCTRPRSPNLPAKFLNVARGMLLLDNPEILQASSWSQAGGRGPGQSRRGSIATDTSTAKGSRQNIGKGIPAEENPAVTGNGRRENAVAPEQGADPDNRNNGRNKEQDEEEKKHEAARALEFDRGVLRDWATRRRRRSAMKIAEVGLKALRYASKCMKTTADFRNDILAHLRSAKDPSKVCRNLGMVASALIGELEFVGAIAAETESETDAGDHNNDTSSVMTMRSAFGREDGRVDGDGTMVQGDSNVAGSAFGTRGVGGSKQVATAAKPTVPNYHQRQKGAAGVGVNSKEPGIGERCNEVRHRLEGVGDILNHVDGGYSPTAARGLEAGTQANMTAMQEVQVLHVRPMGCQVRTTIKCRTTSFGTKYHTKQDMLKEMNQTPEGYRDLALEDDYFTAIKQLLSWTPPPKWERTRDGHKAQLIAAAGVFLKKALILDGPPGFWPLPLEGQSEDRVQRWKMGAGGVPIFIFRRKESLRKAAGGGARSGGRIRHGVWSFGASGFRYASKPPVPPAGRIP